MSTALRVPEGTLQTYQPYQVPTIQIDELRSLYEQFKQFQKDILKEGADFGKFAGIEKPSLFKPGAEKLRVAFGLIVEFERTETYEDLKIPYLSYSYKATIYSRNGYKLAEQEGNCNSFETKYKYIWVNESDVPEHLDKTKLRKRDTSISELDFAIEKAETTGKYGKPAEHWNKFKEAIKNGTAVKVKKTLKNKTYDAWEIGSVQYRIINPEILSLKNTIMKMAQKRAFVGATIMATGASDSFTQDLEDLDLPSAGSETPHEPEPEKIKPLTKAELIKEIESAKTTDKLLELWNANPQFHTNDEILDKFGDAKSKFLVPESPTDLVKPKDFDEEKKFNHFKGLLETAKDRKQADKLMDAFKKDTEYSFISEEYKTELVNLVSSKFPSEAKKKLSTVDEYKERLNLCTSWDNVIEVAGAIVEEAEYKKLKKSEQESIKKYCSETLRAKFPEEKKGK